MVHSASQAPGNVNRGEAGHAVKRDSYAERDQVSAASTYDPQSVMRFTGSWQVPCCCAQPCNSNTAVIRPAEIKPIKKSQSICVLCAALSVPMRVTLALYCRTRNEAAVEKRLSTGFLIIFHNL